jgi:hypothetical protein
MSERHPPILGLGIRCVVCSGQEVAADPASTELTCHGCGARFRSMRMAAILIDEADGGVAPTLVQLVRSGRLDGRVILDFCGDAVLSAVLAACPGYQREPPPGGASPEPSGDEAVVDRLARHGAETADVILFRDILRVAPCLDCLFDAARRTCRDGGTVVFQDRFAWPLPERTQPLTPGPLPGECEHAGGTPAGAAVRDPRPALYRQLGADLLPSLRRYGFVVYADRVAFPLDFYYRAVSLVAQKGRGASSTAESRGSQQ